MKQIFKETDTAKITITFADITDEEREKAFKGIAQACYDLCLHEYKRKLKRGIKANENNNGEGTAKLT